MRPSVVLWRVVAGYEGFYEVSSEGDVKRVATGRGARVMVLKPRDRGVGYFTVNLSREGVQKDFYIHDLVATAFFGPRPDRHEVNHKDSNKKNNSVFNLEWVTKGQNLQHSHDNGRAVGSRWDGVHCANGHDLAETSLRLKDGKRECGVCRNERRREREAA